MTALCHDPRNVLHQQPGHPERPDRYLAVMEALGRSGRLAFLTQTPVRPATAEEILRAHQPALVQRIDQLTDQGGGWLDPDTYCTADSRDIAFSASGGLIDLCAAVARGEHSNGLALLRPPAHHATAAVSMGFCLVNHVAIAARALQAAGLAGKVAIVDFDVHHGNGTEDIFAADPEVFYASSHQYPHYPGTGRAGDRGVGPGEGFTLNVPLRAGAGDAELLSAWRDTIVPAVEDFGPDFLIVSAGYDGHRDDPLAGLEATTDGLTGIGRLLIDLAGRCCGGKVVFNVEGGYELSALSACVSEAAALLIEAGER
jgi:acetoin utilization deacetylase AcuC-like enzyme